MIFQIGEFSARAEFQPGTVSRSHGKFQPGMSFQCCSCLSFDFCETVVAFKNRTNRNKAT